MGDGNSGRIVFENWVKVEQDTVMEGKKEMIIKVSSASVDNDDI